MSAAPDPGIEKDKPLLVLLLFGSLLVIISLLPNGSDPAVSRQTWSWEMEQGTLLRTSRLHANEPISSTHEPGLPARVQYMLGGPLPINQATSAELVLLPGIGPVLADRVIRHRADKGPFSGPADLLQVPGIGSKKVSHIVSLVSFSQ